MDWVSTERTLRFFKERGDYRKFVESGKNEEPISPFERAVAGLVLGSEEFVQRVRSLVLSRETGSESEVLGLRELRRLGKACSLENIREAVSETFSQSTECQKERMLIYILRQTTWMKVVEIARLTGKSPGAVTHTVKSINNRLAKVPDLKRALKGLTSELQAADQRDRLSAPGALLGGKTSE